MARNPNISRPTAAVLFFATGLASGSAAGDVIEWTGLFDDVMGAPSSGRVGGRMIDTLIAHYGTGADAR